MKYNRKEFVDILEVLKENLRDSMEISGISALETNPMTAVVEFSSRNNKKSGMILAGENHDKIVVDVIVDNEEDKRKGTPVLKMEKVNTELIDGLVEWLEKYCE